MLQIGEIILHAIESGGSYLGLEQGRTDGKEVVFIVQRRSCRSVRYQTVSIGVNTAENEVATWLSLEVIAIP